jgi:predicted RNA binding protein YcfA (HicA-like mRNA interferase family)
MIRFVERHGFSVVRTRGSHHFMARGEQRTSVPSHGRRSLKIGTLRSILRDNEMSPDEFERLMNA